MRSDQPLSLPEEILLLALHDEKGTLGMETTYAYSVGGAVLAELLIRERVRLRERGKKKFVVPSSSEPTGRRFLDECLERIHSDAKVRTTQDWVTRIAGTRRLHHRLAEQLCDRGILRADEDKILLLFTRQVYPEVDPRPERELVEKLRRAIFSDGGSVDARTAVLVALADQTGLLANAFDKKDLKRRKRRIEQIGNGDASLEATKQALEALQAAMFVACIMPTLMVTTTH